jgi:Glycosyltransferase family 9 (heptosyltransferase)
MKILIIKLNATGDVVRTTPLLRRFQGEFTWITAQNNLGLIDSLVPNLRCVSWENRNIVRDTEYDLAVNLEDEADCSAFLKEVRYKQLFGAHLNTQGGITYTEDSRSWFDLSLISAFGKASADQLKLRNRRTYQEMVFEGLGLPFAGERYLLPEARPTDLSGDIALAPVAGAVWPMKNWAYYTELKQELENRGLKVNVLPRRTSLLEHLGDVQNHRCLVGGDSLPMHLALGSGTPCVSLFTCTSPWEIYDYGIQTKIVSPLLTEFFYRRDFDLRATTAIHLGQVLDATIDKLQRCELSTSGFSHHGT